MDYPFLIFVAILVIIVFGISYLRKEKLNADFYNTLAEERDNIILEIRGVGGKDSRARAWGECKIDLFLTKRRLYIHALDTINQVLPPHPLILTREQLHGHKKCKLTRINLNSYSDSTFFRFTGPSKLDDTEIRIYSLTTEQKQLIDTVLNSKEDIDGLQVYYLERIPE